MLFLSLNLSDLAPVNLDNGTGNMNSPSIPIMSHTHFISQESYPLAISLSWLSLLHAKLRIDLVLVCTKVRLVSIHSGVINWFSLLKVI